MVRCEVVNKIFSLHITNNRDEIRKTQASVGIQNFWRQSRKCTKTDFTKNCFMPTINQKWVQVCLRIIVASKIAKPCHLSCFTNERAFENLSPCIAKHYTWCLYQNLGISGKNLLLVFDTILYLLSKIWSRLRTFAFVWRFVTNLEIKFSEKKFNFKMSFPENLNSRWFYFRTS